MRFSIVAVLGLASFVAAQSSSEATASITATSTESASVTATATATSVSLSPQQICLAQCSSTDICCQAACVNVPCPNGAQVNATTECAAQCPQGNGTQEETQQYADCQSSCINSYFLTTGVAAATGSGSNTNANGATTTGTGSNTASRSGSSATSGSTAAATSNAAVPDVRFGAAGVGLIGLIMAGLAL